MLDMIKWKGQTILTPQRTFRRGMECLNLRFVRIGSKNTVRQRGLRTEQSPLRGFVILNEVGRQVPDWRQWIDKQLPLYWWACLDRKRNSTVRYYYWWLSTKFWSIYQLQQRVLRPFTVIFHARVWANL